MMSLYDTLLDDLIAKSHGKLDRNKSYPDWPRISDEAITAIGTLTKAVATSGITIGATGPDMEPYQPRPEYEEMLHTGYEAK